MDEGFELRVRVGSSAAGLGSELAPKW